MAVAPAVQEVEGVKNDLNFQSCVTGNPFQLVNNLIPDRGRFRIRFTELSL